jgi:hypothetical protein
MQVVDKFHLTLSSRFLTIKLYLDMLVRQNNIEAIRNALLSPPQGLDTMYDDIIDRV